MRIAEEIQRKLTESFAPDLLTVADESEAHRGHAGWRPAGESHLRVTIRAAAFGGMGRLERHRAVHAALGPDILGRIHALALEISAA